jgi:hypothetical protein
MNRRGGSWRSPARADNPRRPRADNRARRDVTCTESAACNAQCILDNVKDICNPTEQEDDAVYACLVLCGEE